MEHLKDANVEDRNFGPFAAMAGAGLGFHGFGTGLQDVELAVQAVLASLDVHRALVVLFDDHGLAGEGFDLLFRQAGLHIQHHINP